DEGAARRLLPGGGGRPRHRDRAREQDPGGAARLCGGAPHHRGMTDAFGALERSFRQGSGRAVAALIRVTGDFGLAGDAGQDAFEVALRTWPSPGVPDNPEAWIVTSARNRAIDRLRRERVGRAKTETAAQ